MAMRRLADAAHEAELPSPFGPYPEKLPENVTIALPPADELTRFCRRLQIKDLAIYGHVLEAQSPPGAPIELMVAFWKPWTLMNVATVEQYLSTLFDRPVKLIERSVVDVSENPILRQRIYRSIKTLYLEC